MASLSDARRKSDPPRPGTLNTLLLTLDTARLGIIADNAALATLETACVEGSAIVGLTKTRLGLDMTEALTLAFAARDRHLRRSGTVTYTSRTVFEFSGSNVCRANGERGEDAEDHAGPGAYLLDGDPGGGPMRGTILPPSLQCTVAQMYYCFLPSRLHFRHEKFILLFYQWIASNIIALLRSMKAGVDHRIAFARKSPN